MAAVDGVEQADHLLPAAGLHEAGRGGGEGLADDPVRQEAGILAETDEQHAVEEFLGERQQPHFVPGGVGAVGCGVVSAELMEQAQPHLVVEGVELLGDGLFFGVRVGCEGVDEALAVRLADEAVLVEQEDEFP